MTSKRPFVVHADGVAALRARRTSTGEPLGWVRSLFDADGLRLDIVELPPNERIAPPHSHSARDEAFFVIAGRVVPVIDGEEQPAIGPRSCLIVLRESVPATVTNMSGEPAMLLQISAGSDDDDVRYE